MDEGIKLPRKWGLIRCGGRNKNKNPKCSQLLIVKRGQKSKKCPNCGTQRSLESRRRDVLAWSDSQGRIRRAMGELKGSGKYRKTWPRTPARQRKGCWNCQVKGPYSVYSERNRTHA
ncbi:hypothetical protein AKJ51_01685 [candidate division MSBL1 archaeon SCGC-AAA382A20]|uniref:Uncharacterized protein n=1 Tax=candidate division MSBL1 archaeon SCGC-AAA382A20 TaxID=1698280 RepID=A0A133VLF1_9EURY|nr:hypothetical protein AKJ51_01685 [candidate division MSBL1 archaeon SCGC-AAA382A20]